MAVPLTEQSKLSFRLRVAVMRPRRLPFCTAMPCACWSIKHKVQPQDTDVLHPLVLPTVPLRHED